MASMTTTVTWSGGMRFDATGTFGHPITIDISKESGGAESGHRPTELLLWAVAACSGIDIVGILQKQRQELREFKISVTGQHHDDYPKAFHTIKINYIISGTNLDVHKVRQAIALSIGKYCSVSQTLAKGVSIQTDVEIVS